MDALLAQTVNDPLVATIAALEANGVGGVGNKFPAHFAGVEVINDGDQINVLYNADGDPHVLASFLSEVEAVASGATLKVLPVPVAFDPQQRAKIAQQIAADSKAWAVRLGLSSVSGVNFNTVSGEISILTPDEAVARASNIIEVDGVPVSVLGGAEKGVPQNRAVDYAPWSAGAWLRIGTQPGGADCTLGFTWKKWGTGEVMGGGANHCSIQTGSNNWFNGDKWVGTRYYYSFQTDSMLLRSPTKGQFSASVFVGDVVTNDIRDVHGAVATEPVGGAVALSGARSGLHVGTILADTRYDESGRGPFRLTTIDACRACSRP
ncbi:hypothetical protein [Agromyces bauzanensis]